MWWEMVSPYWFKFQVFQTITRLTTGSKQRRFPQNASNFLSLWSSLSRWPTLSSSSSFGQLTVTVLSQQLTYQQRRITRFVRNFLFRNLSRSGIISTVPLTTLCSRSLVNPWRITLRRMASLKFDPSTCLSPLAWESCQGLSRGISLKMTSLFCASPCSWGTHSLRHLSLSKEKRHPSKHRFTPSAS